MRPESRWRPTWPEIIVLLIGALISRGHVPDLSLRGEGGGRAGGTTGREERLKMRTRSDVYVDPPGEGPATKVNKGARIGDE